MSCKKDKRILGVDVQPEADGLNASFDASSKVYTYTKKFDSTASYNTAKKFIGCNEDPYFGKTEIGLYLNANLSLSNINFNADTVLTSAEIILAVDPLNIAGDKNAVITYSVFTLDSALSSTRVYYTNNKKLHNASSPLCVSSSSFSILNGATVIRIPIDAAYAGKILTSPQYLTGNDVFQAKYKGFYIKCSNKPGSQGIIYRCNLEDALSGFYLNYRSVNVADSVKSFRFGFAGSSAARFNTVTYDFTNASPLLKSQVQGDTTSGADNVFLRGMGITKVKVLIPAIEHYADSFKIAVNRAELVLNVDNGYSTSSGDVTYNYPASLALLPLDSLGNETYALDQLNATDAGRYDGGFDSDNKRYVFNIARHVQAIISGKKKNYGFYLVVTDPSATYTPFRDNFIDRVVLCGLNKGGLKPSFNFSYIKFKKD